MERVRVLLSGFGWVGRHFVGLVAERGEELRARYGVELSIGGAIDSRGGAVAPGGEALPLDALAAYADDLSAFPHWGRSGYTTLDALGGDESWNVLVEATPTDLVTGGPARQHLEAAFGRGVDVVSATKGPL